VSLVTQRTQNLQEILFTRLETTFVIINVTRKKTARMKYF